MLVPGKHAMIDIPNLVEGCLRHFPDIKSVITDPLGNDVLLMVECLTSFLCKLHAYEHEDHTS